MRREVWFKEDIGQVLLAVGEASRSVCQALFAAELSGEVPVGEQCSSTRLVRAYQAGFQAALNSLALGFGLLDVAGSLPRSWITVLDEEPARGTWSRVLEVGDVAESAEGDAVTRDEVQRSWVAEDWR